MAISTSALIILTLSCFFTSIVSGMLGMAGGALFLGVLASFVETTFVVPLYALVMVVSAGSRTIFFVKHINWRIVVFYILGLLPGAFLGIYIFRLLPKDLIKLLMGIFILLAVFLPLSRKEYRLNIKMFAPVGFVAGFIGIFFGASGLFTGSFYVRQGIIKEELIATKSTCAIFDHLLKIFLFGLIGINVFSFGTPIILLMVAVIPGIYVGKKLLHGLSDKAFIIVFKSILVVLAARIIYIQLTRMLA